MRKFAAGCLAGIVLLAVVTGTAAYFLWRTAGPVLEKVTTVTDGVRRLGDVSDIERELIDTSAFAGPASGELTEAQVARFVRVQTAVRAALGTRVEAFTTKYRELTRSQPDGAPSVPSLPQLLGGLSDLSTLYLDAWRAQVAAMNAEGFSRAEFSWVRARVYQAAGLEAIRYDARDLERLIEAMVTGAQLTTPDVKLPDAPARNKSLVKPHAATIATWLGMAAFGL
jgi:hypothetical protein